VDETKVDRGKTQLTLETQKGNQNPAALVLFRGAAQNLHKICQTSIMHNIYILFKAVGLEKT